MIKENIINLPDQLDFSPEIKNKEKWGSSERYFLCGMGGSHLQGDILKSILPEFPLHLHEGYGLPALFSKNFNLITASYSGNTEEVLDSFDRALSEGVEPAVISRGGKLLEVAKERELPYVELPEEDIQPRLGTGYSFKALLALLGLEEKLEGETRSARENLLGKREKIDEKAKELVHLLEGGIPVVHASRDNEVLARLFKINFNETTKIPAFYNVVPELNHNEMNGYEASLEAMGLCENIKFLLLTDRNDHPRNKKRMEVLKGMMKERDFEVLDVEAEGETRMEKVFFSLMLSGLTSYHLAGHYGTDPEGVPMVEEFKKRMKE